ncbi:MAG: twin-arginine translocase TatA/TatE family subunit [Candidatus Neomarinimicrobiota bacterium]|jgi:sec-independent protein translocase protein TatA|uniref:Sec-independent protein translocase protein TatA n=1 Tax=marine metagenome TaxID=408172 RepID=A0A381Q2S1_9ZZZZ|nr:twin-arginine translocase TatA/TatE family subunit [Candidatus Neomarinimicrobiota bacterium]MEE2632209.1 twin-arginine translocase TatA/TatE family subunit [Candidatus Neomarinimicrobiota bacterium]MEE3139378.1 twin-arginine translocase TatA/TatE family subunit [Candidatus Neomarinimicrobiota bacterium]|tara:strand:+ start:4982 stop:5158 length:177 start_codon:yes stop_codon:yes gene_type:complete
MGNIGLPELVMIFLVLLLLFGGKRLPGLARGFAKSLREFRGALNETKEEIRKSEDSEE